MRIFTRFIVIIGAILPTASPAFAESRLEDKEKGAENWDGSLEFSASAASGNTENTVLGTRFDARRVLGRYSHDIRAGANYTETTNEQDDGTTLTEETQNNWFAQYRLEIQTGDRTFVYARSRYEQDTFSGFDRRAFLGAGLGHDLVHTEAFDWQVIAGPGVQYTEFVVPEMPDADFEEEKIEVAIFAGSEIDWVIRENVTFEHELDATWTEENSTIDTRASLKTNITDSISTRLTYRVKHETDPADDREATDTQLKASVGVGF